MQYGTYLFGDRDPKERLTALERLDRIKAGGFDFVCLSYGEGLEAQVAHCHRLSLPVENIHLDCHGTSFMWNDGAEGEEILAKYCDQIRRCSALGLKLGIAHVTYGSALDPAGHRGEERFARLIECAEQNDFTLAFENSRASEHLYYVLDHFKGERVRFCYDSGHDIGMAAGTPYFNQFLPRYGDRLGAVHLHDSFPGFDMHVAPFDGAIDWELIAKQLSKTDYAREKLTLEPGGRINAKKEGKAAHELRAQYAEMSLAKTPLMQFYDGYYTAYDGLTFEELLDRYLQGLKRVGERINFYCKETAEQV